MLSIEKRGEDNLHHVKKKEKSVRQMRTHKNQT